MCFLASRKLTRFNKWNQKYTSDLTCTLGCTDTRSLLLVRIWFRKQYHSNRVRELHIKMVLVVSQQLLFSFEKSYFWGWRIRLWCMVLTQMPYSTFPALGCKNSYSPRYDCDISGIRMDSANYIMKWGWSFHNSGSASRNLTFQVSHVPIVVTAAQSPRKIWRGLLISLVESGEFWGG